MAETVHKPTTEGASVCDMVASISLDRTGGFKVESKAMPHIRKETLYEQYNGNLARHTVAANRNERLQTCKKVLQVVLELHKRNIIHGSICSVNVNCNTYSVSLLNARLFALIQRHLKCVPLLPCTPYRSREELLDDMWKPSKAGDIYAVTVLMYTVFAGEEPYSEIPLIRLVPKLASVGHTGLEKPDLMPSALWSAIIGFWKAQPENREMAFEQVQAALLS